MNLNALNKVTKNFRLHLIAIVAMLELQAIRAMSNEFNTKYYLKGKLDRDSLKEYCQFQSLITDYYFNCRSGFPSPWFSVH